MATDTESPKWRTWLATAAVLAPAVVVLIAHLLLGGQDTASSEDEIGIEMPDEAPVTTITAEVPPGDGQVRSDRFEPFTIGDQQTDSGVLLKQTVVGYIEALYSRSLEDEEVADVLGRLEPYASDELINFMSGVLTLQNYQADRDAGREYRVAARVSNVEIVNAGVSGDEVWVESSFYVMVFDTVAGREDISRRQTHRDVRTAWSFDGERWQAILADPTRGSEF